MTKVLIALDESPVSARAARVAVRLFGVDSEFLVINVSSSTVPWVGMSGFGVVAPMAVDPRWVQEQGDASADGSEETDLMAQARAAGVPDPEVLVQRGDPVTQICVAAEDHAVDVIVVGSHDKTALRRLFDPSVAVGVVRETSRPVLVVSADRPDGQ